MTTLAQLADRAQVILDDAAEAVWSQATIEALAVDAIREYSTHFPRRRSTTISAVADQNVYALPADFQSLVSVEYPAGEDPPAYLKRLDYQDAGFWLSADHFDIVDLADASDTAELWLAADPAGTETIAVYYNADHDASLASADPLTVAERHETILILYVIWQAQLILQHNEEQNPTSNSSLLMSQLATNADRARRNYVQALARALYASEGQSARAAWRFDKYDRVY
ncbi:MAG: hypothetical protein R3272_13655 [Candidatus Promineifilaceae bacterium]|nr:hypothetical protein [Candidatus Promineifilaceae bacterium]